MKSWMTFISEITGRLLGGVRGLAFAMFGDLFF
jgi:hypothetical protein